MHTNEIFMLGADLFQERLLADRAGSESGMKAGVLAKLVR
jgi:hypothetical protein